MRSVLLLFGILALAIGLAGGASQGLSAAPFAALAPRSAQDSVVPSTAVRLDFDWTRGDGYAGWQFATSPGSPYSGAIGSGHTSGLFVRAQDGPRRRSSWGAWTFVAPDDATVVAAHFTYQSGSVLLAKDCVVGGFGDPADSTHARCQPASLDGRTVEFSWDPEEPRPSGYLGLAACAGIESGCLPGSSGAVNQAGADDALHIVAATLSVLDHSAPDFSASGSLSEASSDRTFGPEAMTLDLHVSARDRGLGVKRLAVERDGSEVAAALPDCDPGHRRIELAGRLCAPDLSLAYGVSTTSLAEGLTHFRAVAEDASGNVSHEDIAWVYVDRTAPEPVTGAMLVQYDAEAHEAIMGWDPGDDPLAPDSTLGSGVERYRYRIRLDGGDWSKWTTTSETQTDGNGTTALPGQRLSLQVRAIDGAGNTGAPVQATVTIPAHSEVLGGSGEIVEDDGSDPPDVGPPEFPAITSTPDVAVPAGVTPAAHYERFEFDPADTEADVTLYGVASTTPGTFALSGIVIEAASGQPVAGASVQLASGGATATTTTDANGGYAFAEMPPGENVRLSVSAPGFAPYVQDEPSYSADDAYLLTVELNPAGLSHTQATSHTTAGRRW